MNNDILFQFLEILMTFLILPLFGLLCKAAIGYLKNRTENDKVKDTLSSVENMLTSVVSATTQTFVSSLKAEGRFDDEAKRAAFEKSFDTAKKLLTEDAVSIIIGVYGDLDEWLTQKIEEKVLLGKG
ncbi:MAG: hypothetical protein IJ489_08815 [Clostridia bacterium]|nr:hypothetical protein [Clostridia bacterium]